MELEQSACQCSTESDGALYLVIAMAPIATRLRADAEPFGAIRVSSVMPIKSTSQNPGRKSAIRHRALIKRLLEQLRQKLIQFFLIRGHSTDAEYLTDDVIDRLLKKMCDGYVKIEGDKDVFLSFASRVAYFVDLEQRRRNKNKQSELSAGLYLGALQQGPFEAERRSKALEILSEAIEAQRAQIAN